MFFYGTDGEEKVSEISNDELLTAVSATNNLAIALREKIIVNGDGVKYGSDIDTILAGMVSTVDMFIARIATLDGEYARLVARMASVEQEYGIIAGTGERNAGHRH